jgi:phosphoglycolate phosphatase
MSSFWIFDFDGTLVDSEPTIKKCYIGVTGKLAPERIEIAKNIMIGPSLEESSREILGESLLYLLPGFKGLFQKEYDEKIILETPMYPNTDTVLKTLVERGDKIAIATNKRSKPTLSLIKHFQWDDYFEFISCIDQFEDAKDKSAMVKCSLTAHPDFTNAFFVGDTLSDGNAARDNELLFLRANYGYGTNEDWIGLPIHMSINNVSEIVDI